MKPLLLLLLVAARLEAASVILALTPTGDASEDKRTVLQNSNFGRTWSATLGTNWTKIRVALRVIMTNTAANITSTPKFFAGVCNGTNNIFLDATCSNFVGVVSSAATWTYVAGPPVRYTGGGSGLVSCVKNGANQTNFAVWTGSTPAIMADSGTTNRTLFFVDITKGSGTNFTLGGFLRTGVVSFDATYNDFLTQSEAAVPVLSQHAAASTPQVPVDEAANGPLTAVCVGWDRAVPAIHICDIAVIKLQ